MKLIKHLTLVAGPQGATEPLRIDVGTATVFVGPNHSGKSLLLQEISRQLPHTGKPSGQRILHELELNKFDEEFLGKIRTEIEQLATSYLPTHSTVEHVHLNGTRLDFPRETFNDLLSQLNTLPALRKTFDSVGDAVATRWGLLLSGAPRLDLLVDVDRGDLRQRPNSVLGVLFRDDKKRTEFQRIVHNALGIHLAVDPTHSTKFRAVVSEIQVPRSVERSLGDDALKFFAKTRPILEMSDGVRAFSGMIAAVVGSEAMAIMVDEPEAFLHPALCTKLAVELCRKARENERQLFVATHSAPFLLGCIQAGVDLHIVRLTYRQGVATSRLLNKAALVPLMRQPLLRSSGALNGIFYEAVVVTESEADRAFYDEINHRCVSSEHKHGVPDCLFLNAQNWQTVGKIVQPLRRLGVAAAAVVDFDVVSKADNAAFQILLDAVGMPSGTRTSVGQLRSKFSSMPSASRESLKKQGMGFLSGPDREDLQNLLAQLAEYGLFVVPNGELECWLLGLRRTTSISGEDKRSWLIGTFEAMGEDASAEEYLQPGEGDVWAFLGGIRQWVHNPKRHGMNS